MLPTTATALTTTGHDSRACSVRCWPLRPLCSSVLPLELTQRAQHVPLNLLPSHTPSALHALLTAHWLTSGPPLARPRLYMRELYTRPRRRRPPLSCHFLSRVAANHPSSLQKSRDHCAGSIVHLQRCSFWLLCLSPRSTLSCLRTTLPPLFLDNPLTATHITSVASCRAASHFHLGINVCISPSSTILPASVFPQHPPPTSDTLPSHHHLNYCCARGSIIQPCSICSTFLVSASLASSSSTCIQQAFATGRLRRCHNMLAHALLA